MPAKDLFHDIVKNALIQEGWQITHDPFPVRFGFVGMYIDLGAEKLIAAEKGEKKIAVEIKSFLGESDISEFHTALGQFLSYRLALKNLEPERMLYLAVPEETYNSFFSLPFMQLAIDEYEIKILVYSPEKENIKRWTK
ncbi:MAG: element excision factor XisH family protein [Pleurocapsa sp.]